ncbi:MAG TPA: CHASE domain-containing protein, partial [Thermoanaerobaculia bacterium]|nr:CHASE domain-containing protein [Thermoanaerobaculia bacterium]
MSRLRAAVVSDLREHEQILRASAGFFAGSEKVTAAEFAAFVGKLRLTEHDPGVRSLALIVPVRRKDAAAWLETSRADGQPIEKIVTSGDRPDLFLVQYSEPSLPGARALGWDVGTDPSVRAGIERARDTGEAAL